MITKNNKKVIKRLCTYDFDMTLINTYSPEIGKPMWEKYYDEKFKYSGWWGRPESLDTNVFDIKPYPEILEKLISDNNAKDTHVIILTSRQEKLRSQLENVLKLNNIHVDEIVMKKGNADKGDIIMKYVNNNPDLEYIISYDDFAGGLQDKIDEYTKIKPELDNRGIQFNIVTVVNGQISKLAESTCYS
jgi:small nuclear ribonucleoprotein (snRNP)-like protein